MTTTPDTDQAAYVDTLAGQLCKRHTALLATAENDLAVLRARLALTVAYIHDPAIDRDARIALAQRLGLPEPFQEKQMQMTTQTDTFTPDATDMEATHYSIPVSTYGEDGNMLALGHHDKRRAFAAFNKHARTFLGLANFADDRQAHLDDWLDEIRHIWLTFHRGDPNGDWTWEGRPATETTPGAVPVTLLDVA